VYSRANLSRTAALVVALFLTAAATGAVAREFRAADTQKTFGESAVRSSRFMREKWKDLEQQSRRQAEAAGVAIVTDFDRKPFEAAMAAIYQKAQRDPAVAQLIERIRKVE
jgi:TRAP-type C4-dicarboxylate transport system substrate-binding protein